MKKKDLVFTSAIILLGIFFLYACGEDNGIGSSEWSCDVTLTLVPSTFGSASSPSGSGTGSGTGSTQEEALKAALRDACSKLNLDSNTRSLCESGQDFGVSASGGSGVTLISAVDRSQRCSTR